MNCSPCSRAAGRGCPLLSAGCALLLLSTLNLQRSTVFAQGPLSPPGPPAPTMKTLQQIEPRTPISSAPFTINQPGSYYLTTNFNIVSGNGITISANNVTVDLNGFALTGNSSGYGIYIPNAQTNVTVRNGSMDGWSRGVYEPGFDSRNVVLERLPISSCAVYGIDLSCPALVRNCLCASNVYYGIYAQGGGQITDCEASNNGQHGINAVNCVVRNCRVANNGFYGIYIILGTVSGCRVDGNVRSGIYVDQGFPNGSDVFDNLCLFNNTSNNTGDAGIFVSAGNCRIEGNHVTASGWSGITVSTNSSHCTNNIIVKNFVSGNGPNNYLTPGNQVVGPLITTYGTITNSNPWANFSY